jgi:DNA-binding beta-propeller fold protein YncE
MFPKLALQYKKGQQAGTYTCVSHLVVGPAARFNEPRGVCADEGTKRAWVCDTNNHAIRVVDLTTGEVETLALKGVPLV